MAEARGVFDALEYPDAVSWNAIVLGYAENGDGSSALELFSRMGSSPNERSFVAALKACSSIAAMDDARKVEALEMGVWIHWRASMAGCCDSNVFVSNSLVDMYAKCGSIVEARRIFDGMEAPSVVSWNSLLLGFAENGQEEQALAYFAKMVHDDDHSTMKACRPDSRTFAALAKACSNLAIKEGGEEIHGRTVKLESLRKVRL
ncbi:pentatricopeptide repeat-containing protein At1g05750, chloroplastic-like [Selaginella moellendorffii]|uniref:pentatricopeptide repeat-containing protein At1g05750, chloroplastic-like n=1 Tax=Selaginella moellendorffii TaxID=88036 RepID=UPI000D1C8AFD|nr:pentatricopeptide repeat-containing protein At1g05750, chloroplastic-like [Selaginella moellendorffii]|eukprot:XP_024545644.1 pentatricopeptide repeat-containing protein At1g05750, chloroplastic-like [Selaginella moellendorffii]